MLKEQLHSYILNKLLKLIQLPKARELNYESNPFTSCLRKYTSPWGRHRLNKKRSVRPQRNLKSKATFLHCRKRLTDLRFTIPGDIQTFKSFYREMAGVIINTCAGVKWKNLKLLLPMGKTSVKCRHQQWFGPDVQFSVIVLNFNNISSNGHLYRAGQLMNYLPSQIPNAASVFDDSVTLNGRLKEL